MKLFKKNKFTKKDVVDNPYINTRIALDDHLNSLVQTRQVWQVVSLLLGLIALAAVGGLIAVASKSKFIPYIVTVDEIGEVKTGKPLYTNKDFKLDTAIYRFVLKEFITNLRTITADISLKKQQLKKITNYIKPYSAAANKINMFLNKNNPLERAKTELVTIDKVRVLTRTLNSWDVHWTETIYNADGIYIKEEKYRATMTITEPQQISSEIERENPFGIFITNFDISLED